MSSSDSIVKPLAAGLTAVALDMYVLKNENMQSALIFGGTVAGSTFVSEMISKNIPSAVGTKYASTQERVIEVLLSTGVGYSVNKFVFKNDYNARNMMNRIGIIAASNFVGEYASDYFATRPLVAFYQN
jgi:uncharacterized membrane protein YwzB